MSTPSHETTLRAIDAIWRIESAKIVAAVARLVRDIGLAEDFAHNALVAALEHWPEHGLPDNPAAWLTTTAKHAALDHLRRLQMQAAKHEQIGHDLLAREALIVPDFVDGLDAQRADDIGDDMLRLIFTACHPIISTEQRVALTLKILAGLSTQEIARAYLSNEATIAQRIVRAKRTLSTARVPFELPNASERASRLASVLEVIYLIFNEGYTATAGEDWMRHDLAQEALRLGRILGELSSQESEVHGLLALMELQTSRMTARVNAEGRPVLLMEQDRGRWDPLLIRRGLAALQRATDLSPQLGPYALQAAIAACHARASTAAATDWPRIVELYDSLMLATPSPVIELNRAVAVGMAFGPQAALDIVDHLADEGRLTQYPWLSSVRADLLAKLGRHGPAAEAFAQAAELTANRSEQALLQERARQQTELFFKHLEG